MYLTCSGPGAGMQVPDCGVCSRSSSSTIVSFAGSCICAVDGHGALPMRYGVVGRLACLHLRRLCSQSMLTPTRHSNGDGAVPPIDESIAVKANALDKVSRLLGEISEQGKLLTQEGGNNRRQLLESVRSLSYALETPREAMIRYCWSQVCNTSIYIIYCFLFHD